MIRVLKVLENGGYEEVPNDVRLAGITDAIMLAQTAGDGKYAVDYDNGQYQVINVRDNNVMQFNAMSMHSGNPAAELDRTNDPDRDTANVMTGGLFLPEDGIVGTPEDRSVPAMEDF